MFASSPEVSFVVGGICLILAGFVLLCSYISCSCSSSTAANGYLHLEEKQKPDLESGWRALFNNEIFVFSMPYLSTDTSYTSPAS